MANRNNLKYRYVVHYLTKQTLKLHHHQDKKKIPPCLMSNKRVKIEMIARYFSQNYIVPSIPCSSAIFLLYTQACSK